MCNSDRCRLQDLSTEAIAAHMAAIGSTLTLDQILAVEQFVERIGGLANAHLALGMLERIDRAA